MAEIGRRIALGAVSIALAAGTLAGPVSTANAAPVPSSAVSVTTQDGDRWGRDWDRRGWDCHRYRLHRFDRWNWRIGRWCHRDWDRWDRGRGDRD